MSNERLGKYEILKRLAVGGMAEIFLARSTGIEGFEKYVVVKRILPQYVDNQRFVTMFLDEARLAGRLQHQHIAQVYDIGQEGGQYFFAMEFLHGEDLRSLLIAEEERGGRMPLPQALTIIAGAASGLHYAHEEVNADGVPLNIVHRDISPANLVITFDGGVKVVDFGIARAAFRNTQTRAGALKGKRAYMSPEQCRTGDVDRRSDVFSLGIVLWEMTTMSRLFRRSRKDNEFDIMNRIITGDITPPRAMVKDYPPGLERIVMKALAIDREQRYPTCKAFLDDVEELAASERMRLSTSALATYVEDLLGKRPKPWRTSSNPAIDPTELLERAAPGGDDEEDTTDVTEVAFPKYTPVWPRLPDVLPGEEDDDEEDDFAGATVQMRPEDMPDEVQEALPTVQYIRGSNEALDRQLAEALEERRAELAAEAAVAQERRISSAPTNELYVEPKSESRGRWLIFATVFTLSIAIGLVVAVIMLD